MVTDLITSLVQGKEVSNKDVDNALYAICDDCLQLSCCHKCPIFKMNSGIPLDANLEKCVCLRDADKMRKFLCDKQNIKEYEERKTNVPF